MLVTVHIPAYHAGKDFPSRSVGIRFPGLPPEGLQIVVRGQDEQGVWQAGVVEVVSVCVDPGWSIGKTAEVSDDNREGWLYAEAFTNWVRRPNG